MFHLLCAQHTFDHQSYSCEDFFINRPLLKFILRRSVIMDKFKSFENPFSRVFYTVKLANSASPFKFRQVNFLQKTGLELLLWMIKCVFHKQCQLYSVSIWEKHILSFSRPVLLLHNWDMQNITRSRYELLLYSFSLD